MGDPGNPFARFVPHLCNRRHNIPARHIYRNSNWRHFVAVVPHETFPWRRLWPWRGGEKPRRGGDANTPGITTRGNCVSR